MPESSPKETVSRLKELLFDREARELDTLNRRLADIDVRAGSDAQFQKAVARVLDRAVRDAEASRHRELSDALAPMVLRALRAEMKSAEMQDQIAGVMYPRMGEMVKRYVASAIRDMMQEINRRLETGLAHNRLFLWIRSVATGRSMAELALAETQQLEVQEIYLVRRGSGMLVHHWRRPGSSGTPAAAEGDNRDTLVSGFLAAITALAEEAFEADKESLRTLDLDDHRIYLRGSPDHLLAAKCTGSAPAGIDRNLDAELIRVLAEHQAIERGKVRGSSDAATTVSLNALLSAFAGTIEQAARERTAEVSRSHGTRTLKILLWLLLLPFVALAAWSLYVSFVTQTLQTRADDAIAAIPKLKGYPVKAHVERGGGQIWVAGLAPDEATRRQALDAVKSIAPEARLSEAIGVLPDADVAPIARRIDDVGETAAARTAEVDRLAEERIAALDRRYRARLEELEQRLSAQQPAPLTPRQHVAGFIRSHAIFFSNDSQYRDEAATGSMLDELARLLQGNDVVLRVIGYTDEVGTVARNSPLSQARAEKVMADLVARGVPPDRLIAIGRLNSVPIAPGSGVQSPNRRVEFEIAFDGEKGGR